MPGLELIATAEELAALCARWRTTAALAVDFEGEWNCHRYGNYLCLIQVADRGQVWLIDALAQLDLDPFWSVLTDAAVLKVMHDPQCDFLLLDRQFSCHPRNTFDTAKAGYLLGREKLSLSGMLHDYCGVDKEAGCQADDWNVRPLSTRMREYAAHDVRTLLHLYDMLRRELEEKGRLDWHGEECRRLENIRFVPDPEPHLRLKGAKRLPLPAREVLRELHALREKNAKQLNKPPYQVISNQAMLQLAQEPPENTDGWRALRSVHPIVKRSPADWHQAAQRGRQTGQQLALCPPPSEPRAAREPGERVARREKILGRVQKEIVVRYPDIHQLVLSHALLCHLARGEAGDQLRHWQRAIIAQVACDLGLELSADWFPVS